MGEREQEGERPRASEGVSKREEEAEDETGPSERVSKEGVIADDDVMVKRGVDKSRPRASVSERVRG